MKKNVIYGYCRISTMKQRIQRQIDNIKKEYPEAVIISEAYTGTSIDRPAFNKLLKQVKNGDTIVFDEVSRMSRNAADGFALYEELFNKGVELVFIKEPHINTATYKKALNSNIGMTGTNVDYILDGVNKFLMALAKEQIELAFKTAQAEVEFLHQRTSEGVRKAQERYFREEALGEKHEKMKPGRQPKAEIETKKAKEAKKKILELSKDFNGSNTDSECIKLIGCSRNSFYKYKSELRKRA